MKFLVIMRPNGQPYQIESEQVRQYAGEVRAALSSGDVEAAYAFVAGGGAFVTNADNSRDLVLKVRMNPYFKASHVEVIPIVDADVFLEGIADYKGL
jgi:hypothetical protein